MTKYGKPQTIECPYCHEKPAHSDSTWAFACTDCEKKMVEKRGEGPLKKWMDKS